jgi:Cd2+/Zn2+-exporting ATPase
MAESDIEIAMGAAGTDIAVKTRDFVLMSDELAKIPYVIKLSRRTTSTMRQNIVVSLLIITFLMSGLLINEVDGLIVITNGLRLLR